MTEDDSIRVTDRVYGQDIIEFARETRCARNRPNNA